MNFNETGLKLLKEFEGCSLVAYPDPATRGEPFTIGYGHTGDVKPGDVITQQRADALLQADIIHFSVLVRKIVKPVLNDNQFSAAVCFAYNVRGWEKTPLFTFLREGQIETAEAHWTLYCDALVDGQKVEVPGIKRRREAELALFEAPVT